MAGLEKWAIVREPDDRLSDVRISLGSAAGVGSYLVFRGDPEAVLKLLRKAVVVAEETLPRKAYVDKRGRPQG